MGTIFSAIGGAMIWLVSDGLIFGIVFLLSGLAILGFGVYSTYTSCLYYYEQALLKQYGKSVEGVITHKIKDESIDKNDTSDEDDDIIQTNLFVQYQFTYLGKRYDGESTISDLALFEAIEIGMKAPILVMKDHPNITRLQAKKLKRTLNVLTKSAPPNNVAISQPLLDEDEWIVLLSNSAAVQLK